MTDQPVPPIDTDSNDTAAPEAAARLSQVEIDRRTKLAAWRAGGRAYPNDFHRDTEAAHLHRVYGEQDAAALEGVAERFAVAGRLMAKRVMGKASFGTLQDATGRIQVFCQANTLGPDAYEVFKTADVGDILGLTGRVFRTKTGELSVWAESLTLLTKNLKPLPEKWAGLTDTETRYRQRYVDLTVNPEVMDVFRKRSKIIGTLRRYLDAIGYQEVETPMLQPIPGGATAKPFVTHHNALDHAFYLRIAPELYLKRLVVGGFEKVYEINRNFRNEGLSTRHNPEFTMLEFYEAYADYARMMDRVEDMVRDCHYAVGGGPTHTYQGREVDMESPFARLTMREAVARYNPEVNESRLLDADYLREVCAAKKVPVKASYGAGKLLTEVFEATVEGSLFEPTFITEYPTEVSPLARASDADPRVTDRFEFFLGGREIANGFSELNDPEDQASRFHAQVAAKDAGDDEAMFYDHDYIRALEVGMPPAGGAGVGVDRLVMFLTDQASIRDVLLFPQMRPEAV